MEVSRRTGGNQLDEIWHRYSEVAGLIQIPLKSLYELRKKGQGPKTRKFGRHLRVADSDLRDWLRSAPTKQLRE